MPIAFRQFSEQPRHILYKHSGRDAGIGASSSGSTPIRLSSPRCPIWFWLPFSARSRRAWAANPSEKPDPQEAKQAISVGAYVSSIAVNGFRGIGPRVELELSPGPRPHARRWSKRLGQVELCRRPRAPLDRRQPAMERAPRQDLEGRRAELAYARQSRDRAGLLIEGLKGPIAVRRSCEGKDKLEEGETVSDLGMGDAGLRGAHRNLPPVSFLQRARLDARGRPLQAL